MEEIRVPARRGLAPLVGAGMAAVAAGSLVMFSVLARQATTSPPSGSAVVPRGPQSSAVETVTLPPAANTPAPNGTAAFSPVAAFEPDVAEAGPETPPATDGGASRSPRATGSLFASFDLEIRLAETVDFEGPDAVITPSDEQPPGEPNPDDDCPGPVDKERAAGEHPHGGPPACGNPHGAPPGYDKDRSGGADPPAAHPDRSQEGGSDPDRSNPPSSPPGQDSTPPKKTPPPANDSESDDGSSSEQPDHPHGGPPGQSKDEADESADGGNPHGEPPGQAKKTKS